jgi:hypothetical protein
MWHPLRRLDRFILIHAPLVWRTRLLYFLFFSAVVANAALYLLGWFQPVARAGVPNVEAVRVVGGLVYTAGVGVLAYWVYVQFRIPLPESGARRYVALTLLHAVCAFTILINGFAYQSAIVPRIAAVVPDDAFAQEYAYHATHRFWLCGVDREAAPVHRSRIDASLQAWGLPNLQAADVEPGWYPCDGFDPATMVRPPLSMLRDRMASVHAAKALRRGEGSAYTSFASVAPGFALLSLLFGAALLPAFVPASAWKRRFVRTDGASQRFRLQLPPHPSWLRRLDRSLVASHPLVWSLQLHTFGFALLVYAALPLIALVVFVSGFLRPDLADVLRIGAIVWAPPAGFLLWVLVERRIELHEPRLRGNRTALAAYYLFVMAVAALAALVALTNETSQALLLLFVMMLSGNYAAAWVYVAKYLFTGVAGLILLGSLGTLGAAGFLSATPVGVWVPISLWIVATGLVTLHELRHAGPTRSIAVVAGAQILLMPAAALVGWFVMFDVLDPKTSRELPIMLAAIPLFLLIQVFLAKPAMHTLIRYRYWPHSA